MKIKTIITTLLTSAVLITCSSSVFAGEVDVLVNKLVEKKILTESEAKDIVSEIKKESEKSPASWAEKVKLKGDVRVRYQSEDKENDGNVSRDRARIRARLGVVAKPDDKWEVGIGAATGGSDPRSTNQTLDNTFETTDLRLDYAYAKYSPNKSISIMAGKIENPIWGTKDLMWDSDIYPDGIAATFEHKFADNFEMFFTPAYFVLEEYKSSKNDPSMLAFQPGISWKISDSAKLKFALAYYSFSNVKGNDFSEDAGLYGTGTNSVDEEGNLIYDYNPITLDADIAFKLPMGFIEYANIFGQYVDSNADSDNTGYLYGFKVGSKSLKSIKSWELKVNYRELEKDAWLDFLPDSDFYGGATDVKGMEYELKFGLTKHVEFALDYYDAKPIDNSEKQNILQADLVVKF